MINYYKASQFKLMDEKAISIKSDPAYFIKKAGHAAAELIFNDFHPSKALLFCGKGNNGRDGLFCAIELSNNNVECTIVLLGKNFDEYQKIIHESKTNVKVLGIKDIKDLGNFDIIVDSILGVGQNKPISGDIKTAVDYINSQNCIKVAIDVPTGVNCDNGTVSESSVICKKTYTFTAYKPGLFIYPAKEYCNEVQLVDVGISTEGEIPFGKTVTDLHHLLPRPQRSHKGSFGRVVCFVGSPEMAGAAYFCGKSAYLCGAGLVEIVTCYQNRTIISTLLPEAVLTLYGEDDDIENIAYQAVCRADSIAIGCGLGRSDIAKRIVKTVAKHASCPVVYDADGLNIISDSNIEISLPSRAVFTPHIKELSRLSNCEMEYIQNNILSTCQKTAKEFGVTCLAKDANTVISFSDGTFYINTTGNNGMATAGSGDVLSGIIAGLLAYSSDDIPLIAATAAYIHGMAGDIEAKSISHHSLMASDIMNGIHKVFILNNV